MKKNKIIIIIVIVLIVLLFIETFICLKMIKNDKSIKVDARTVHNVEKKDIEIPKFTIVVKGLYDGTITNKDLEKNNVQVYEFDAAVENSWDIKYDHYIGVKLSDVIKSMKYDEFSEIEFYGPGKISVVYDKDELDSELTYLVFYRNNELIDGTPITLLSVKYLYNYSIEDLTKMVFK